MIRRTREAGAGLAREIAPDVFCLEPWGRTQTAVYFVRPGTPWVLIDAGWAHDASRIERAARLLFGSSSRPAATLLTHCHPHRAGSALPLARTWGCAVYMHPAELPTAVGDLAAIRACAGPLDRWVLLPLMRATGRRRPGAVLARVEHEVALTFEPGDEGPGLPGGSASPRQATSRTSDPVTAS